MSAATRTIRLKTTRLTNLSRQIAMKSSQKGKKLSLQKLTLTRLDDKQSGAVQGGVARHKDQNTRGRDCTYIGTGCTNDTF
jgi:hypothetical protein